MRTPDPHVSLSLTVRQNWKHSELYGVCWRAVALRFPSSLTTPRVHKPRGVSHACLSSCRRFSVLDAVDRLT